jgi:hypothetical protein
MRFVGRPSEVPPLNVTWGGHGVPPLRIYPVRAISELKPRDSLPLCLRALGRHQAPHLLS